MRETTLGMPTLARRRWIAIPAALWTWCICASVPVGILYGIIRGIIETGS